MTTALNTRIRMRLIAPVVGGADHHRTGFWNASIGLNEWTEIDVAHRRDTLIENGVAPAVADANISAAIADLRWAPEFDVEMQDVSGAWLPHSQRVVEQQAESRTRQADFAAAMAEMLPAIRAIVREELATAAKTEER